MKKIFFTALLLGQGIMLFAPPKTKITSLERLQAHQAIVAGLAAEIAATAETRTVSPTRGLGSVSRLPDEEHNSFNLLRRATERRATEEDGSDQPTAPHNSPNGNSLVAILAGQDDKGTTSQRGATAAAPTRAVVSSALATRRLEEVKRTIEAFNVVDDDGEITDETKAKTQDPSFLERFTIATRNGLSAVQAVAASCGLISQVSRFYHMPEHELDKFIQSQATPSNEHQGYRDIETAILDAIARGDTEAAILLFNKMSSKKSHFTAAALQTISKATKEYQKDIDSKTLQFLLLQAKRTARAAHMRAEANTVNGPSHFQPQDDDAIARFVQEQLRELKQFASKDLNQSAAAGNNNGDDDE